MRTKKFKDRYHLFMHLLGLWYKAEKELVRVVNPADKQYEYEKIDNKRDELIEAWKSL